MAYEYQVVKVTFDGVPELKDKAIIVPHNYVTYNENIPQYYVLTTSIQQ